MLGHLAEYHFARGDLPAALDYYQRAVAVLENSREVPGLIGVLSGMGILYGYMNQQEEAVATLERAVALAEQEFGAGHPWTANRINDLAVHLHVNGDHAAALALYQRALAIAEERLGPRAGLRRVLMTNLGELERDRGAYRQADEMLQGVARLYEETSGRVPAYLQGQIALLRLAEGKLGEAQRAFEQYFAAVEPAEEDSPEHAPITAGYQRLLEQL